MTQRQLRVLVEKLERAVLERSRARKAQLRGKSTRPPTTIACKWRSAEPGKKSSSTPCRMNQGTNCRFQDRFLSHGLVRLSLIR